MRFTVNKDATVVMSWYEADRTTFTVLQ